MAQWGCTDAECTLICTSSSRPSRSALPFVSYRPDAMGPLILTTRAAFPSSPQPPTPPHPTLRHLHQHLSSAINKHAHIE